MEKATFAGGCFWCMEQPFEEIEGVIDVISGYTGGDVINPTYEQVCTGKTGHYEAVEIRFDPLLVSYPDLLKVFWRNIDPTDPAGQFADKGTQYKTAIFYHNDKQREIAERSKITLQESGKFEGVIATEILPARDFYKAEEYHQDYYKTCPLRYKSYKKGSGRENFIKETWGKNTLIESEPLENDTKKGSEALKTELTPMQYKVTQECGTEPPFKNKYWDNKKEGIYVDIVSGEPLFISTDKFESGTGWPSFTKPLESGNVVLKEDNSLFMTRTEVRSKEGDSHLGHVFNDGPDPSGQRYCINSAALKFIPKEELGKAGYGKYKKLFSSAN